VTLSDFAADVRAATPSAAAELVVPDRAEIVAALAGESRRLRDLATRRVAAARTEVRAERRALERLGPQAQLLAARERVGLLLDRATRSVLSRIDARRTATARLRAQMLPTLPRRLERARSSRERSALVLPGLARARVDAARSSLQAAAAALGALGPQATLERGYAIVRRTPDGRIVRERPEAPPGTDLRIRVAHGEIDATVTS
jgi:exodeoxyribonuclease VII large subunit